MKIIVVFFMCGVTNAFALSEKQINIIVDAIYLAEGGKKAKVPYGILSVKVRNEQEARRVCANTVRNNWRRWVERGRKGKYLDFLGNVYCPAAHDKLGNVRWKRNVRIISGLDI